MGSFLWQPQVMQVTTSQSSLVDQGVTLELTQHAASKLVQGQHQLGFELPTTQPFCCMTAWV
jgi:hypothetical protein